MISWFTPFLFTVATAPAASMTAPLRLTELRAQARANNPEIRAALARGRAAARRSAAPARSAIPC
jgi:hypothetical protein